MNIATIPLLLGTENKRRRLAEKDLGVPRKQLALSDIDPAPVQHLLSRHR